MSIQLLIWILAMFAQTALLGIVMYTLICLSDLENDFLNPHDASERINKWALMELVLQALVASLFLATRSWLVVVFPLGLTCWIARDYIQGKAFVDVTEIFRNADHERKKRFLKLAVHVGVFMITVYKLVNTTVDSLVSEEGRALAKVRAFIQSFGVEYVVQKLISDGWYKKG